MLFCRLRWVCRVAYLSLEEFDIEFEGIVDNELYWQGFS